MSRQIVLRSPTVNKRQPLLLSSSGSSTSSSNGSKSTRSGGGSGSSFAEVAGGTTAECAAVCCCCPCGLVNLLVMAIYKLPAGLCRKAWKEKRKQQLIKKGLLPKRKRSKCKYGCDELEMQIHPVVDLQNCLTDRAMNSDESERRVVELEKEMWERFYSAGFWRTASQRQRETTS